MDDMQGRVRRVTWVSLAVNVLLTVAKFLGGLLGHSQAVVADAVHSLSDIATDVALLVGMHYWNMPSDSDHPYGHKRIETLTTAFLGLVLAATGIGLGYRAVVTIVKPHPRSPGAVALIAALVSIGVKEVLYHVTVAVGRKAHSTALVANAWHHRSDALSSIPSALAVSAAMLLPEWQLLDHVGAIIVCILILQAAWRIGLPAANELVDASAPPELQEAIMQTIRSFPRVERAHALRTRHMGARVAVDFHILVSPEMTVREGHTVSEGLKAQLLSEFPDVGDVIVHIEPLAGGAQDGP